MYDIGGLPTVEQTAVFVLVIFVFFFGPSEGRLRSRLKSRDGQWVLGRKGSVHVVDEELQLGLF